MKYVIILISFVNMFLLSFIINANSSVILIDPGHSPNKPGAISCNGEKEYKYNYILSDYIRSELIKNNISSKLTKLEKQEISLIDRTKNSNDATLLISIHHDSVQPQFVKYINGYPESKKASGYSLFVSRKNKYFHESVKYAKKIGEYLYSNGLRPSKHHSEQIKGENREIIDDKLGIYIFDDLVVLKNSKCPALLLEAGVIVNSDDNTLVKTSKYKSYIARAILNAISMNNQYE